MTFCFVVVLLVNCGAVRAQATMAKQRVFIDIAHKQRFWNDPADMAGMDPAFIDRMKYMTGEITKTAAAVNATVGYFKSEIKPDDLKKCDLLFIHLPSAKYTPAEVEAITTYVANGGAMFLVMDSDYWSTLEQTGANDLIKPFGIQFGGADPDTKTGGSTKVSPITSKALRIPFHDARLVTGGTPFCYNIRSDENPFGVFAAPKNGGKLIVMGEGMVSLYMTSWEGVTDYQCQEFMTDCFRWLLKK